MNPSDQKVSGATPALDENETDELIMEIEDDVLRVSGDIDLYVASKFQEQGMAHVRAAASPRLDMTGVLFLDSAGLAALVSLAREAQAAGKTLRLRVTGSPRRVLRITGIDQMITVEE